jgi:MOSC domain-containing protein
VSVRALYRYPVKSMLGEPVAQASLDAAGLAGDRGLALVDVGTGRVATAKHPRRWRALLQCSARTSGGRVLVRLPDGAELGADDAGLDAALTALLGRPVRLTDRRPDGAVVERPDPVDVLAAGVTADVPYETLEIGKGSPAATFVDYAPVHVIDVATLRHLGVDERRYRPNLVVDTGAERPFAETGWVGRDLHVGGVRLRVVLPTPRCSVPTLEHGAAGRAPEAVRTLLEQNRIPVEGFGVLPCAGAYALVEAGGTVGVGDPVAVA